MKGDLDGVHGMCQDKRRPTGSKTLEVDITEPYKDLDR